jgi:chromosome segregation ATPase
MMRIGRNDFDRAMDECSKGEPSTESFEHRIAALTAENAALEGKIRALDLENKGVMEQHNALTAERDELRKQVGEAQEVAKRLLRFGDKECFNAHGAAHWILDNSDRLRALASPPEARP